MSRILYKILYKILYTSQYKTGLIQKQRERQKTKKHIFFKKLNNDQKQERTTENDNQ